MKVIKDFRIGKKAYKVGETFSKKGIKQSVVTALINYGYIKEE